MRRLMSVAALGLALVAGSAAVASAQGRGARGGVLDTARARRMDSLRTARRDSLRAAGVADSVIDRGRRGGGRGGFGGPEAVVVLAAPAAGEWVLA
jgi:hypothetical protein